MGQVITDTALFRQCITALDSIYSQPNIKNHIETLNKAEAKVFANQIKDFESFKDELSSINGISLDALDSSNNAKENIVEEQYKLPIFSSITYRTESVMYSVCYKSPDVLNSWLDDDTGSEHVPLRRLFISGKGNNLVDARDNINAILTIFNDPILTPIENDPIHVHVWTNVVIVHPVGPLHPTNVPGFEGWMKVSIIKKSVVEQTIPVSLAKTIFQDDHGFVQKTFFGSASDPEKPQANEVIRQFAYSVIASGVKSTDNFYDVEPYFDSVVDGDKLKGGAPILHISGHVKQIEDDKPIEEDTAMQLDADTQNIDYVNPANIVQHYSDITHDIQLERHWKLIEKCAGEAKCSIVDKSQYSIALGKYNDALGLFKRVYFADNDAILIFQQSTIAQRITEIACLLKLRSKPHVGQIKQIIRGNTGVEAIGFTMPKYDMSLKEYLKQNRHLSSDLRMHLIVQMITSIKGIHEEGIAHRDLSPDSFMVNVPENEFLADGAPKVQLYLIDFGKAVFFTPQDTKKWWSQPSADQAQVNSALSDELTVWCKNLPYVMARPDYEHYLYRSIKTLPKSSKDKSILPYLINAPGEDLYSLGALIWLIISGGEPWPGVSASDFKRVREISKDNADIDKLLDQDLPYPISTILLKKLLRTHPEERRSAADVLSWVAIAGIHDLLLPEWKKLIAHSTSSTSFSGTKRDNEDDDQSQPLKKGRLSNVVSPEDQAMVNALLESQPMQTVQPIQPVEPIQPTHNEPTTTQGEPSVDSNQAVTEQNVEAEAAPEPKPPKVPKKYYTPTGRPVGRPRKKAKFKPPGRPKGSKNKVYYYVDEATLQEEREAADKALAEANANATDESTTTTTTTTTATTTTTGSVPVSNAAEAPAGPSATTDASAASTPIAPAVPAAESSSSSAHAPDASTIHVADASTIAEFNASAEMFKVVTSELIVEEHLKGVGKNESSSSSSK